MCTNLRAAFTHRWPLTQLAKAFCHVLRRQEKHRKYMPPNNTNMLGHTHARTHTQTETSPPPPRQTYSDRPTPTHTYTHTTPVCLSGESLCWELHAFPITSDRLPDCPDMLRETHSLVGDSEERKETDADSWEWQKEEMKRVSRVVRERKTRPTRRN